MMNNSTIPEKEYVDSQIYFPIYVCSKEIIKRYNKVLRPLGLTYTQYIVMMYFWQKKQSNMTELSNALMIDPSTLTPLIKKLALKGFITRQRAQKDERYLLLTLTRRGAALEKKTQSIPESAMSNLFLDGEEMKQLNALILKMVEKIRNSENDV